MQKVIMQDLTHLHACSACQCPNSSTDMDKSCVHHQGSLCVSSELSIPDPSVASIFALASDLPCILFSEGNPASYGFRKKGDGCIPHQSDSLALNSLLPLVSVPGSSWIARQSNQFTSSPYTQLWMLGLYHGSLLCHCQSSSPVFF